MNLMSERPLLHPVDASNGPIVEARFPDARFNDGSNSSATTTMQTRTARRRISPSPRTILRNAVEQGIQDWVDLLWARGVFAIHREAARRFAAEHDLAAGYGFECTAGTVRLHYAQSVGRRLARKFLNTPKKLTAEQLIDALIDRAVQ
jgi:hypothetical protein